MFRNGLSLVAAEVFQMRKRASTWVLLAVWGLLATFFSYVFPYLIGDNGQTAGINASSVDPALLPEQLVQTVVSGFPFYGGAIALMLGVLTVGSEFGWGTFKTLFSQRPGRGEVFAAKAIALAIMLVPFVFLVFAIGAGASALIAWQKDIAIVWPGLGEAVRAMLAGELILAVWAAFGVLLAVVTRGTALAIGIGIIWALVIEGMLSAFANSLSWLETLSEVLLRANAYSLVEPLGGAANDGPGAFSGPYVGTTQALLVLIGYIVVTLGASYWLVRRRDVV